MKKEYLKPEMMISLFDTKDVIICSETRGLTESPSAAVGENATGGTGITIPYGDLQ